MQTMQRELVVKTAKELQEIMRGIKLQALCVYLDNYKFNKYRVDKTLINRCRYIICDEFLSLLYTLLMRRGKIKEGRLLKNYFEGYKIKNYDLEVY